MWNSSLVSLNFSRPQTLCSQVGFKIGGWSNLSFKSHSKGRKGFPCYQDMSSGSASQCMSRIKARLQTILSSILRHPCSGEGPSPAECRESDSPQETLHTHSGKLQKQNWNVDTIVMRLFIAMTNMHCVT